MLLPHCLVPFVLLTHNKFVTSYMSMYFCLYLFLFTWPLWKKLVKAYLLNENIGDTTAQIINEDKTAENAERINDNEESAQEKEIKAAEVITQVEETETSDHDKKNV